MSWQTVDSWTVAWWTLLVPATLQATLVAAVVLLLVFWGRRLPAPWRYGLLVLALVKFLLPPFAAAPTGVFSRWGALERQVVDVALPASAVQTEDQTTFGTPSVGEPPQVGQRAAELRAAATDTPLREFVHWTGEADGAPEGAPSAVRPVDPAKPPTLRWPAPSWPQVRLVLFAVYLGGVATMVVTLTMHALRVRRELRGSLAWAGEPYAGELRDFARREVSVRTSATALAPYSAGLWRPVVVIPDALAEVLSPQAVRAVLAHEAAHHRRGDLWLNAVQKLVLAAWWWHPLVWLLDRQLSHVREECCDDAVLADGAQAVDYCTMLLEIAGIATRRQGRAELTLGLGASHALAARFRQIMAPRRSRRTRLGWVGWGVVLALGALLLPGLPAPRANAQARQPEASPDIQPSAAAAATAPTAPPAATRTLTGKVVDEHSRPVFGAGVWAVAAPTDTRGAVLGVGTTDERGEFRLDLAADPPAGGRDTEFAVIAFQAQAGVGGVAAAAAFPMNPVLKLDHERRTTLGFREPSGPPAAEVLAGPASLRLDGLSIPLPRELSNALAGRSDAQGLATVWGLGPKEYGSFLVQRADLGEQNLFLDEHAPRTALALTPAGRVEGRVLLPPGVTPEQLGARLELHTNWVPGINHTPHWLGTAELTLDSDGRFVVPALREGPLLIQVVTSGNAPWWPAAPRDLVVNAGQTTQLEIPVVPAALIQGRVVDRSTRAPVADVSAYLHLDASEYWRTSNVQGEFQLFAPPGASGTIRYTPQPPYFDPSVDSNDGHRLTAPESGGSLRLPEVELERGALLTAQVVDSTGKPAAGVTVVANWRETPGSGSRQLTAKSGGDGRVTFDGVSPTAELELKAYREQVELAVAKTRIGQAAVELYLPTEERAALRGRVVDAAGRPLPGIAYQIRQNMNVGPTMFVQCPVENGLTDAEGRFVSPPRFLRQGRYEVAAMRDGQTIASTMRRVVDQPESVTFADLVFALPDTPDELAPTDDAAPAETPIDLQGVVLNASGQPIPAAEVAAWSQGRRMRTSADSAGRFRFPQVSPAGVWLFGSAPGFRFHGGYYVPGVEPAKLMLTARDASVEPLRPRNDRLTAAQDALLRKKFGEYAAAVMAGDDHSAMYDVQWLAPRVDPELALNLLVDPRFDIFRTNLRDPDAEAPRHHNVVRTFLADRWAGENLEQALAAVQGMSAGERFRGYLALLEQAPAATAARRAQWLNEAATDARLAQQASGKILALAQVATQYDKLGQRDRARALFHEALELTRQPLGDSDRDEFAIGYLSWAVAPVDPQAALALLEKLSKNTRIRTIGNLAHQFAAFDPAEAERLLAELPPDNRNQVAGRACSGMAPVDLPRAKRIADAIGDQPLRAHAHGLMAFALSPSQPAEARRLLDEAFDELQRAVEQSASSGNGVGQAVEVALSLLAVAETVAPDQLEEFVWRTLSLRGSATIGYTTSLFGRYGPGNRMRLSDPVLASMIARYDAQAARQILLPPDDQTLELGLAEAPSRFFRGLAAVDPAAAINAVSRLPSRTDDDRERKQGAWQEVVEVLTRHGIQRRNWLLERQTQLGSPDQADFY
jgi:beta-lactamase regulating signal transducer with metallopeptidase domain/protocatechuate 3,4-dioxygenase beta subunit